MRRSRIGETGVSRFGLAVTVVSPFVLRNLPPSLVALLPHGNSGARERYLQSASEPPHSLSRPRTNPGSLAESVRARHGRCCVPEKSRTTSLMGYQSE